MSIKWNKVTWYSKAAALALFLALPIMTLYAGIIFGQTMQAIQDSIRGSSGIAIQPYPMMPGMIIPKGGNDYYHNPSTWQTNTRKDEGFSIAYPLDFIANDFMNAKPVQDWRLNANGTPGRKAFTLIIPKAVEPQTNFSEATLTVGSSGDKDAIAHCLDASGETPVQSTQTINGVEYHIFKSSDAGAGNLYDTTSYRTVQNGRCFAIEYTLHSTQIDNYPMEYHLKRFDANHVESILKTIIGTFRLQ
jgi:hypothetical protein